MKTHSERWKAIEKDIARIISELTGEPCDRIPINGREGPDITPFFNIAVNVKHRKSVPSTAFPTSETIGISDTELVHVRLNEFHLMKEVVVMTTKIKEPKVVTDWYNHMLLWSTPNGQRAGLILHRPNTSVKSSVLVLSMMDYILLKGKIYG